MNDENMEQLIDLKEVGQGKKSVFGILGYCFISLLLLGFIFNIVTGHLNLYRVHEKKEPYFLISDRSFNKEDKNINVYYFGVYKIIEVESDKTTKTLLRIWFYDEDKVVEE